MTIIKTTSRESGFTLVELFIYMASLIVALSAVYSIFTTNTRSYSSQENKVEMTQDLRAAMDLIVTEIRMAAYDPTQAGGVGFVDNADDKYDTDGNSVRFTMDANGDGDVFDNINGRNEDLNYYVDANGILTRRYNDTTADVAVDPGKTTSRVAENVTSLAFSYRFADGGTGIPDETDADDTNDLADIRSVQIAVTCETAKADAKKRRGPRPVG